MPASGPNAGIESRPPRRPVARSRHHPLGSQCGDAIVAVAGQLAQHRVGVLAEARRRPAQRPAPAVDPPRRPAVRQRRRSPRRAVTQKPRATRCSSSSRVAGRSPRRPASPPPAPRAWRPGPRAPAAQRAIAAFTTSASSAMTAVALLGEAARRGRSSPRTATIRGRWVGPDPPGRDQPAVGRLEAAAGGELGRRRPTARPLRAAPEYCVGQQVVAAAVEAAVLRLERRHVHVLARAPSPGRGTARRASPWRPSRRSASARRGRPASPARGPGCRWSSSGRPWRRPRSRSSGSPGRGRSGRTA